VFEHGKDVVKRKPLPVPPAAMKNGKLIVVHGRITYYDVFGISHWIHFCRIFASLKMVNTPLDAIPPGIEECSKYNEVDKNDLPPTNE
jgi:hypothetical protein